MTHHVHIFGASGSGTTTLGAALATRLRAKHLDTDDYYWFKTELPFTSKRPPDERVAMILRDVEGVQDWVLSGSLCSWGDQLIEHFSLAIFVTLSPELRLARLRTRERQRFGERIDPGGDMHEAHLAFLEWAANYADGVRPGRSLAVHRQWMLRLPCPILEVDSAMPVELLCRRIMAHPSMGNAAD